MAKLGVNIDHVATVREARKTDEPDPVWAAILCQLAGADCITIHLREDRRHIQDRDLELLRQTVRRKLNLEMALSDEIIDIALETRPDQVTIVPEKREELTTEGGLDVLGVEDRLQKAVERFHAEGIIVSLFIDPNIMQIEATRRVGADAFEIHTGSYANTQGVRRQSELTAIREAATVGNNFRLIVHAGHGLTYENVLPVARTPFIDELNIGHSIIARAVLVGMEQAVREMRAIIEQTEGP